MLRRVRAAWPFDWTDAVALVGLLLLASGCWIVSPALSLAVTGALLLGYALMAALPPRGET